MTRVLYATKDDAEGQLNASILAASTSIVLLSGEGAEFPQPYTGTTTSGGSSVTLNKTSIGSSGIAVGDFIRNVTDGSWAFVITVSTDSLTTTRLRGGTDNSWDNGDEYQVNEFVITLETRNASTPPQVTASEKVLIKNRSGDTLTARTRGYDGSTAQSFTANDFVNLHVVSVQMEHMIDCFYDLVVRVNTNQTDIATNAATFSADIDSIESNATFFYTATGSSNAYAITTTGMPAAYTTGERVFIKANHTNSGTITINRNGLGAKTGKKNDGATNFSASDFINGQIAEFVYDGTNYQLVSPVGTPANITHHWKMISQTTNATHLTDVIENQSGSDVAFASKLSPIASALVAAGDRIVVEAFGGLKCNGTPTCTIKLKYGSTDVAIVILTGANNAQSKVWKMRSVITADTVGASGNLSVETTLYSDFPTVASTTHVNYFCLSDLDARLTSFNTTTQQDITITANWSASHANNEISLIHIHGHRELTTAA